MISCATIYLCIIISEDSICRGACLFLNCGRHCMPVSLQLFSSPCLSLPLPASTYPSVPLYASLCICMGVSVGVSVYLYVFLCHQPGSFRSIASLIRHACSNLLPGTLQCWPVRSHPPLTINEAAGSFCNGSFCNANLNNFIQRPFVVESKAACVTSTRA